jgi:hypothetical protein
MEGAAMKNSSGELLFHPQKGILNYVNHKKETHVDRKSDDFYSLFLHHIELSMDCQYWSGSVILTTTINDGNYSIDHPLADFR